MSGGNEVNVDPSIIRLSRYRHPELGVSLSKKPTEDRLLRDLWHDKLKKRIDYIWSLMKEKYNASEDLWSTERSFRNYHENDKTGKHSIQ
jgi:hypothetical protein